MSNHSQNMSHGDLVAEQNKLKKELDALMKKIGEFTNSVDIPTFEGRNDPEKFLQWLKKPTTPKIIWDEYDDEDYDPIWDEELVKENEEVFEDAEDNPFWVTEIKEEEQEKTHEEVVTPDAETSARGLSSLTVLRTKRVEFLQAPYEKKIEKSHDSKWSIQPGDLVWVHIHKARLFHKRKSKLQPQDDGPFEVLAKVHKKSYVVDLTRGLKVAATFHRRDLSPYEDFEDLPSLRTNSFEDREDVISGPGPMIPSPMSHTLAKTKGLTFKHYDPF
ncbi:unnamed protein product [Cuscuta campestris]|uniref:Tf2-1-like SH3-like domain-containing protein n=1 Tax=Cuscuta campestris TaxID=132261 RepID=A0A484L0X0_9ASTE|nr:unnamed protein product [Cuscuta campestris]